jgi:hypothetical protein
MLWKLVYNNYEIKFTILDKDKNALFESGSGKKSRLIGLRDVWCDG